MAELKECFGQLANMSIRFRDQSKQHFLRIDQKKLKECDNCHLFNKCMFLKYNELLKEIMKRLDQMAAEAARSRLG